jgi:hypothetical protein
MSDSPCCKRPAPVVLTGPPVVVCQNCATRYLPVATNQPTLISRLVGEIIDRAPAHPDFFPDHIELSLGGVS